jgi:hypothetical protein
MITSDSFLETDFDPKPLIEGYTQWIDGGEAVTDPQALFAACHNGSNPWHSEFQARWSFIERFGYTIISAAGIDLLNSFGAVVEIGAGTGYLSHLMRLQGGDAVATDISPNPLLNLPVKEMDADTAIQTHQGRTVLSSWPSLNGRWLGDATVHILPGQHLIVIGEGPGGATAAQNFFDQIGDGLKDVTREHIASSQRHLLYSIHGLHDRISIFEKQ